MTNLEINLESFLILLRLHLSPILISIGIRCRRNSIRKDFISSIAYRSKINTVLTQRLNRTLDDECRRNGFTFVDDCEFICQRLLQMIIVNNLIKKFNNFLESANLIRWYIFVYIFVFIFYGVSHAKTNLWNKYMTLLCVWLYF